MSIYKDLSHCDRQGNQPNRLQKKTLAEPMRSPGAFGLGPEVGLYQASSRPFVSWLCFLCAHPILGCESDVRGLSSLRGWGWGEGGRVCGEMAVADKGHCDCQGDTVRPTSNGLVA